MARARNIKPKFFENEDLAALDPLARLLFIGLWTISDFKGCLEYRPKRIKVQILPYDECDITELANYLDKSGFISIYSVKGQRYIKIVNFSKHQNPHKNERDVGSDIPDISEKDNEIKELNNIEINRDKNGTARADSLNLIPDSLNLIPDSLVEAKHEKSKPEKTALASRLPADWNPSPDDIEFCKTTRPDLNHAEVCERFRDYWASTPGAKGRKLDWSATWRNWVRNEKQSRVQNFSKPEKFDPLAYVNRNRMKVPDERIIDLDANGEPIFEMVRPASST